jgi:hypothetical protein
MAQMRGSTPRRGRAWNTAIVVSISLSTFIAGAGEGQGAAATRVAAKQLTKQLKKRDLYPLERPDCRHNGSSFRCTWRAEGRRPADVPFECRGRAKSISAKRWRIKGCDEKMVTLADEPGAHPVFGFNEQWWGHGDLRQLPAIGADVARQSLHWADVEPAANKYHWPPTDSLYQQMLAAGVRPIWVLSRAACWAQDPDPSRHCYYEPAPPAPDHYGDLADLAAVLATRYPLSAGIEVWNEPNYRPFWGAEPDPAAYGQMAGAVATAVHQANPSMPVISAGLAPVGATGDQGMAYEEFLRKAYQTGGPQLTDAIGAHPYPLGNFEQNYLGAIRAHLYRYRRVMNDFGEADKAIWVTEVGVSNFEDKRGFRPDEQAQALTQIYEQFRLIAGIPVVLFHRFQDDPAGGPKEAGYGVVDKNGQVKPAYCAIAAVRGMSC